MSQTRPPSHPGPGGTDRHAPQGVRPTGPPVHSEEPWPTAILDAAPGAGTVTVVARQEIEYLLPIDHRRDPLTVELWLGRLGGASVEVCYEVTDVVGGVRTVFVQALTTLVMIDAATGQPRRITAEERAAWQPYSGPPVQWRRGGA